MELPPHLRYQHKPFYGSSHWWAVSRAAKLPTTSKILDVGAGSGAIAAELRNLGFTELYAVEIDAQAREHIAPLYRDVRTTVEGFAPNSFDLVFLLDVLEHCTEPAKMLATVLEKLAPGGIGLISVPNIAHWSVRLPLLCGHFSYTSRGILDRTHYQFFTRRSLAELVNAANLTVVERSASIEPVELVLPRIVWQNPVFSLLSHARRALAHALPGLMAFQHLMVFRK